jgi:hypothetical protein
VSDFLRDNSNSNEPSRPDQASGKIDDGSAERGAASPSQFSEDEALAIVHMADVTADTLAQLARNSGALKSRKVVFALATHPRTPRHVSIPLLRRMFTFDLVKVALTPTVAADIKRAAEEQIVVRIESLSTGEKITLGRRGPGRIAAALLAENDGRIVSVALDNGRLVEPAVVAALMRLDAPRILFELVSKHSKWSQRYEVQLGLLKTEKTPLEHVIKFAAHFSQEVLREIVPETRRPQLLNAIEQTRANSGST